MPRERRTLIDELSPQLHCARYLPRVLWIRIGAAKSLPRGKTNRGPVHPMRTSQECIDEAERCEAQATKVHSDVLRAKMDQVAKEWRALAGVAEKRAAQDQDRTRARLNDNWPT